MHDYIKVVGARVHNLKNVTVTLPRNQLIVFTGLSGSGKSSLAFDTIFAEGQRRYMESLSSYARQFLDQMDKPDVDSIDGLSPAISIDQKTTSQNPRSTVGTITEIYDYLRLLYASIGKPHCPQCGKPIQGQSIQEMANQIMAWPADTAVTILSPVVRSKKGEYKQLLDTLQKEGFTRARINGEILRLDDAPTLDKQKKHTIDIVVDRVTISPDNESRLFESLETAVRHSEGLVMVESGEGAKSIVMSEKLSCTDCGISITEISPRLFSFNAPTGACPGCKGLGDKLDFDPDLVIQFPDHPIRTCTGKVINLDDTYYGAAMERTGRRFGFDLDTPFSDLTDTQRNIMLFGRTTAVEDNPFYETGETESARLSGPWEGLITNLRRRYFQTQSEGMRLFFQGFMSAKPCRQCNGARLRPEALGVTLNNRSIFELTGMSIVALLEFITTLPMTPKEKEIITKVHKEIVERLQFLKNVGLDYLSLNRKSGTLSGGESQRIRLATQIGSGLTGVLYVLDEPSIGLHQRDNQRLIDALIRLRDLGNTLIVVEHDEDMIRQADYIVDIGPAAGRHGGHIVFEGTLDALETHPTSSTAHYISGRTAIPIPTTRRTSDRFLTVVGATENNLKNITATFPLGCLVCVTGVSGSGKSTLVNDILHTALMRHFYKSKERPGQFDRLEGLNHLDKIITIDQSPIGRTPRSNPATYTGLFGPLRELFAASREAKIRGYSPGRFSFNVKGGRCEACEGDGVVKIEMHFLSDVYVTCDVCKGKRYNTQTLEVHYKGHSISDVLHMTVDDALDVFSAIPPIASKLKTLQEVGLGYIHLGQNATTLSGGEAQRIKLAKELSKRSTGKTIYLLDEPTTGLHFADIAHLLDVLNRLVKTGNTVIVIEHNLDVIKTADHIIDLGPEGGIGGGSIVAAGTPETIAATPGSYTGQFLAPILKRNES